jgi:hypothetical protein
MAFFSVLNQIFYPYKKFDDPAMIESLEKWMFVPIVNLKTDTVEAIRIVECVPIIDVPVITIKEKRIFSPKKQDTLFWCAYVANHGEAEYWLIGTKYKNTELSEKQKVIEFIQNDKATFKAAYPKITNVKIQETMSEIMLDKITSLGTFMALCLFYKFHAILNYNKTYLEFSPNIKQDKIPIYLFVRNKDGHFSFQILETIDEINDIKMKNIKVEKDPFVKPLKSISSYKIDELLNMAKKLGIEIEEKSKKQEVYEKISNKCMW